MAGATKQDEDLSLAMIKLLYYDGWGIEVKQQGPFIHVIMT